MNEISNVHGLTSWVNPTLASSAEKTISNYKTNELQRSCWGCNDPNHGWMDKKTKQITCPNKDKPGVKDNAAKLYAEFKQRMTERKRGGRNSNDAKKKGKHSSLTY